MRTRPFLWRVLALVLVSGALATAQDTTTKETITIAATAIGLSSATYGGTGGVPQMNHCAGVLETAPVRFWSDGAAPSSTVGILVATGSTVVLDGAPTLRRVRFIRTTGVSGVLSLECTP